MKSFKLCMCQWESFAETDLMYVVGWPSVVLGIITYTNDGCGDPVVMHYYKVNQVRTSFSCCLITKGRKQQQKPLPLINGSPTRIYLLKNVLTNCDPETILYRLSMGCHTVSPAPVWVRIPGSLNPGTRRSRVPGWRDPGIRTNTGAGDTVLAKHT